MDCWGKQNKWQEWWLEVKEGGEPVVNIPMVLYNNNVFNVASNQHKSAVLDDILIYWFSIMD